MLEIIKRSFLVCYCCIPKTNPQVLVGRDQLHLNFQGRCEDHWLVILSLGSLSEKSKISIH